MPGHAHNIAAKRKAEAQVAALYVDAGVPHIEAPHNETAQQRKARRRKLTRACTVEADLRTCCALCRVQYDEPPVL